MRKILVIAILCAASVGFSQNVGIGTNTPFQILSLHGGSRLETAISFSNNATGTGFNNSMSVGFVGTGNPSTSTGFIGLPTGVNFSIGQGAFNRLIINPNGNVGIGMTPYNFATLNVNGPGYFFAQSNQGAFVSASDTGTAITLNSSGFGASKRLSSGLNFINLLMRGDRPQAYIEANFKNGTANQGVSTVVFDSLGRVGIGSYILDSSVNTRLHVFGSQTIQQGILYLHGHRNNYTQGSEIRFQYNGAADDAAGPLSSESWYSIEQEDADNPTTNRQRAFAIVENYIHPLNSLFNQRNVGFVLNNLGQVGIGRYPDKALESEIKVDIAGKARINGGLQLTSIGEAAGRILVTNASGDATWQNPPKITLDQPLASGQSVIEFRNQGLYVGGFGWSEASTRYFLYDGSTNTNPLLIKNGRIGIGNRESTTNTLEVNGNASKATAGDWLANSDARLKKDIQPLQGALQKLLQLKGITYQWNDDKTGTNRPEGNQMGFTAQNIQQVFPQLVSADAQGFLQTAYGTYDALYVEAIRQLVEKVELLEKRIEQLSANKK